MIVKLYSVKDKLVGFGGPIGFNDENIAERWFNSFCSEKKVKEYTEPKYFDLYEIGKFDTDKGTIEAYNIQELKLIKEGEQINA